MWHLSSYLYDIQDFKLHFSTFVTGKNGWMDSNLHVPIERWSRQRIRYTQSYPAMHNDPIVCPFNKQIILHLPIILSVVTNHIHNPITTEKITAVFSIMIRFISANRGPWCYWSSPVSTSTLFSFSSSTLYLEQCSADRLDNRFNCFPHWLIPRIILRIRWCKTHWKCNSILHMVSSQMSALLGPDNVTYDLYTNIICEHVWIILWLVAIIMDTGCNFDSVE
jgi:hypothetical protein